MRDHPLSRKETRPMRQQPISPRGGIQAILALALLAAVVTGCGIGKASNEGKISKTATTYLLALADEDTAEACTQLTRRAKGERCEAAMKERLSRLDPDALAGAADDSMNIAVDGNRATARLSEPEGARFLLVKAGAEWKIDSGYTLGSETTARIPATPVGKQVTWALAQLNGGAAALTEDAVAAHFTPQFLAVWMPARELLLSLQQTAAERGPFTFTGFAYPPTATQAVALIETKAGERGSLRIEVAGGKQARIVRFEVDEAPPAIEATGPYSGRFDVGGRELFLHCTGAGSPTVIFQGGLTTDWVGVQSKVAQFTRACSYDPANGLWGRSDPAPTPRTAKDVVGDLDALLAAAKVPGPYVLVGHSNGGLFVQLYASEHQEEVAGLVLLDAVSVDYYARRIALLKKLLPPAEFKQTIRGLRARLPAIIDPEQIDIEASLAETRAALATAPLRALPLFVLTHGRPESESDPRLAAADERLWRKLQAEIGALVPRSKHVIARRSGHDIHHEQPELVVAAIRDVVEAVRDPSTWTRP
jgi:pimeloyl-ACP methyl ester carboxylesterase